MEVIFILVNTARGEHLGFAARALKTMGFTQMRLVNSQLQNDPVARKTAYGSHDLLEGLTRYKSLAEAIRDLDLVIGTTSKKRIKRYDYHHPHQLNKILAQKFSGISRVGLVFGSEENGLSTEDLEHCDIISSIPMASSYPSLNLSQAVLIYAWELKDRAESGSSKEATGTSLQRILKDQSHHLLDLLDLSDKPLLKKRMLDRLMLLGVQDMELMLSFMSRLKRKFPGQSSREP